MCQEHNILNTPISPYIDKELLHNKPLFINGSKISDDTGFAYDHPNITTDLVREQLESFIAANLFPPVLQ